MEKTVGNVIKYKWRILDKLLKKGVNMANRKMRVDSRINKQKELEQKRRKKRKKMILVLLILIVFVVISAYLLTSERFSIKEIIIEGNEQLEEQEIYEISEIKIGDNIFTKIGEVIKVKIKQNGYVEDAEIQKIYPNKIKIKIKERKEEYQIITETGTYIYIDSQGYIIDYSLEEKPITIITGMEIKEEGIEKKKRLEEKDLGKMENILHIEEEIKKIEIGTIEKIDTKDEYILHYDGDKIIINLGDATNLANRMYYVRAILEQEKGNSGTLYVNGNINDGFAPYFSAN